MAGTQKSAILFEHRGGAVTRVGRDETAFDHRDVEDNDVVVARWTDPTEADQHLAWARELSSALRSPTRGVDVDYLGVGDGKTGGGPRIDPRRPSG